LGETSSYLTGGHSCSTKNIVERPTFIILTDAHTGTQ